jgi:hypothetical protein
MIKIFSVAVGIVRLFNKMGMNDCPMVFDVLKGAPALRPIVNVGKRRHDENEEDKARGRDEDGAAHGGYYRQLYLPNQQACSEYFCPFPVRAPPHQDPLILI